MTLPVFHTVCKLPWFLNQSIYYLYIGELLILIYLVFYPAILLKANISWRNPWWNCQVIYVYSHIIFTSNSDTLALSFLICIAWISFRCLMGLAEHSNTILTDVDKVNNLVLFLVLLELFWTLWVYLNIQALY